MKHPYLLTIFLFSLSLLSCGDDSENKIAIIEDSHTVLKRQLCEAFGLNPSDLDEDAFGACWNDQFLVVSALRTTDSEQPHFPKLYQRQSIPSGLFAV